MADERGLPCPCELCAGLDIICHWQFSPIALEHHVQSALIVDVTVDFVRTARNKGGQCINILLDEPGPNPLMGIDHKNPGIKKIDGAAAKRGTYSLTAAHLTSTNIVDRMTPAEIAEIFDRNGDMIRVKPAIRDGIAWSVGDVGEPEALGALGMHDIVVANNFLCHMNASDAEKCLRNITRLVKPGGYVFVSGIDLTVRTRVAATLGWMPLQELLEDIHEGDSCMRDLWPFDYASLEPLNKQRRDWTLRYAAAFQTPASAVRSAELATLDAVA